ncbi:MAG: phosphopantetheine-binding protein [Spirochaetota bacterium]|nr:phosphopantetheine-binding protein [Spirochaetota bacterium]
MDQLINELKAKIIETLELPDITTDDIHEEDQLIGGDLGLDSIDALELVMMIEKDYSVKIDNKEVGKQALASVKALAQYIKNNKP